MTLSRMLRLFFVLSVTFLVRLNAQVATGNITVTVNDGTGAVVPGASVKVTNNNTGLVRTGASNERGELLIPFLPVGQYSIGAESPGFKTTSIAVVVLQVDQTASLHIT